MKIRRTLLNRAQIKSSEGEFIWELENSYELSPKISQMILWTAKECLLRENLLQEGQVEITAVEIEERAGKTIEKMEKKKIRITEEAIEQSGVLSQEDIEDIHDDSLFAALEMANIIQKKNKILQVSIRTIKRDINSLKQEGIEVITRGYLHNIGRGQTHKVRIIGMYLDGNTYSEIKIKARHSTGAIKRYLESFTKVVMAQKRGIYRIKDISSVTGVSETLVKQYSDLIRESKKNKTRKENLDLLAERNGYREHIKKTVKKHSSPLAAMMGGL